MFSHLTKKIGKKLIILTLLVGVLAMPVSPLMAEEMVDALIVSPPVVLVTPDLLLPIVDSLASSSPAVNAEPVTGGNNDQTQTTSDSFAQDNLLVQPEKTTESITENSFVTLSDLSGDAGILAISEEQNGGTASTGTNNSRTESGENSFTTTNNQLIDTMAISGELSFSSMVVLTEVLTIGNENSFTTQTAAIIVGLTASEEGNFTTLSSTTTDTLTVSVEQSFSTLDNVSIETLAISAENNFTTLSGGTTDESAISEENSFTTSTASTETLAVSDESSFTTLPDINTQNLSVSDELSFTTLNNNQTGNLAVSDEQSFTTNSNGGGGGGGGGYYTSGGGVVLGEQTYNCPIYLKKFIKFGQPNDRLEVIKLQIFLRVFEGFKNLKITGIYDRETFEAVKIFQARYLRDVLTPWGIDFSTGWVYITTRLAINNIYCGRDTKNNLHFRKQVAEEYYLAIGEDINGGYFIVPTTTPTTTASVVRPNVFLAGLGELLDFISDNFCWLLNLLLLLLIFFLLWLLWEANRNDNNGKNQVDELAGPLLSGVIPMAEAIGPADEKELAKLAEEDEVKLKTLDNNPWQEPILLGPEASDDKEASS